MRSSSFMELSPQLDVVEAGRSEEAAENDLVDDPLQIADASSVLNKLTRWKKAALVLNSSRRFRYTLDLRKEEEKEMLRRRIRAHAKLKISQQDNNTEPVVGSSESEISSDIGLGNDSEPIVGSSETESSIEPIIGSSETESSYITVQVDGRSGDHEADSRRNTVWNQENDDMVAIVGSLGAKNSHVLDIEDGSTGYHEAHGRRNSVWNLENNDTDAFIRSSRNEDSHILDIGDGSTGNHEADSGRNIGWSRKVDFEWMFLITNFILELPSAALDELSSVHKPQYALAVMIMSFAAILICIAELIYKGRREGVIWRCRGTFPWFYYPPERPSERCKPFGTFKNIVALACALGQCIVTTINYAFCRQHADIPIKISVWPIIFAFGLLCSKYVANSERRITS